MRTRFAIAGLFVVAFAACDLNPQPLPPVDDDEKSSTAPAAGGDFGLDASARPPRGEHDGYEAGTADASDGSDAGDDAAPDASLDGPVTD